MHESRANFYGRSARSCSFPRWAGASGAPTSPLVRCRWIWRRSFHGMGSIITAQSNTDIGERQMIALSPSRGRSSTMARAPTLADDLCSRPSPDRLLVWQTGNRNRGESGISRILHHGLLLRLESPPVPDYALCDQESNQRGDVTDFPDSKASDS